MNCSGKKKLKKNKTPANTLDFKVSDVTNRNITPANTTIKDREAAQINIVKSNNSVKISKQITDNEASSEFIQQKTFTLDH